MLHALRLLEVRGGETVSMAVDCWDEASAYTFRVTYYSGAAEVINVEAPPQRIDTALGTLVRLLMDRTTSVLEPTSETSLALVRGIERIG